MRSKSSWGSLGQRRSNPCTDICASAPEPDSKRGTELKHRASLTSNQPASNRDSVNGPAGKVSVSVRDQAQQHVTRLRVDTLDSRGRDFFLHGDRRCRVLLAKVYKSALDLSGSVRWKHATLWGLFLPRYVSGSRDEGGLVPKLVWRVTLVAELEPGLTTEVEVARLERDEQASLADRGLRLAEARQLTSALQVEMVPTQGAVVGERRRSCEGCGGVLTSKGHDNATFRSLFGACSPLPGRIRATQRALPSSTSRRRLWRLNWRM